MSHGSSIMIIFFGVVGFVFRLWIAWLVPQPFVFDQEEYYGYALGMLRHGLHADLYRLYGYPLTIAPLIAFFGAKSAVPWTVFHAFLDTATAFLVFWIARNVFKSGTPAWTAFIIYLFNPFTAGYTGVLLSEIVTIFLVTLTSALIVGKKSLWPVSILLGFLPQVRPVFIALSCVTLAALAWKKPMRVKALSVSLFFLPFAYTVAGNLVYYRQFSIVGVEPTFTRELYASLFIGRGMPFTDTAWADWPPQARQAWVAFTAPKDAAGRKKVADQHRAIAIGIIRADPFAFVRSRIAKMGYVWEKHFIYPYRMGKPTPMTKALTYWGNIALLFLVAIGMACAANANRRVVIAGALFFFSLSLAHIFSTSEERFTLPAYPWVAVFAGYGVSSIASWFRRSWSTARPECSR